MNTLRIEATLAEKYKYKPLPGNLSEKYRGFFTQNIPYFLSIAGGGELYTCCGSMICKSYRRIVVGDYGAFVEFSEDDLPSPNDAPAFKIAPGQEYRINDERYAKNVKYIWLTAADLSGIKIYYQKKGVSYADYKPGMYYVSVHEVFDTI